MPVPPNTVDQAIKLTNVHLTGPTVFVAGRYRKLSRELSQSPWILGGKRVMADSVQEIIAKHIAPYFGVDPTAQANQLKFMASGREDVNVCFTLNKLAIIIYFFLLWFVLFVIFRLMYGA